MIIKKYILKKTFTKLNEIKTKAKQYNFNEFSCFMLSEMFQNIVKRFLYHVNNICLFKLSPRKFSVIFLIAFFPNEIIPLKDRTLIDNIIIDVSQQFININSFNYHKIFICLTKFVLIIDKWIDFDKNRLIQSLLISLYFKKQHIEKIKKNNEHDSDVINELNKQHDDILKIIKKTDRSIDINYINNNCDKIINSYFEGYQQLETKITNTCRMIFIEKINNLDNIDIYIDELLFLTNKISKNYISKKYNQLDHDVISIICDEIMEINDDDEIKNIKIIINKTIENNMWNKMKGEIIFLLNDKINKLIKN